MAKLTIVIPHFRETWDISHYIFDSLAIQRGINFEDFEVLVCNDGQGELKIGRDYPFTIRQLNLEHRGVSATRNSGLDAAETDYVMFCDADDMFLNMYGMHLILDAIDEKKPDIIVPQFVEEQPRNGKWIIIQHDNGDCTFVHGKVWSKPFLTSIDHRFDESLTIHEDGYFVSVAMTLAKNIHRITTPYYLWRWNEKSVVRHDHEGFLLKTYEDVMKNRLALCGEMKKRNLEKEFMTTVIKTVTDAYYDAQFGEFKDEKIPNHKILVRNAEKSFRMFWAVYGKDFKKANKDMLGECLMLSRNNAYKKGFKIEKETLKEFLNRVCEGKTS